MSFIRSLVLSFLFASSFQAAIIPPQIEKRGVSTSLFANLNLMEQYAGAAYCQNNANSPNDYITCSSGNCPLVEANKAKSILEFQNSRITDVTGFVAVDHKNKLVVVSFRGSRSLRNFLTDFNFKLVSTNICTGCKAHQGFWTSWIEARKGILDAAEKTDDATPGYQMVLTGHSLGGAIATLAAAELRNSGHKVDLYTYGSPRVGNARLASYISAQPGGNYRVTHANDPVPHMPFIGMGFQHTSPEYFISAKNGKAVAADGVALLQGSANLLGNLGRFAVDIASHLWYFNGICDCSIDKLGIEL